ncbi:F-box protein At5g07610-like isoform X2 [Panicum hallii]|uniref:F-box protein At5g07610-like isoform X2 n=1 Tax=Panicum hallii TaxID=206008 RepID=UPI000DF4EA3F|nr:F-box protein At5g07610-like isoform X2 [Panicum hallii]
MDPSGSKKRASAAADLTDDLIVEILSRLPVKSICRFKCVSRHWHGLISHPEHRKTLPQTLSGFFYPRNLLNHEDAITEIPDFVGISRGEELPFLDPSLPFLPGYRWIRPEDSSGGLLLCNCWKENPRDEFNYVVCNPATDKWVVLPEAPDDLSSVSTIRLGFDPAISSHFHVFQLLEEDQYGYITGLNIYSSETGVWSHKENGWSDEVVPVDSRGVFMNEMLHLISYDVTILTVDTEGKTWRTIPLLESMGFENFCKGPVAFLGQSQGRLCYMNTRKHIASKISVWILEDYSAGRWIFKYNISTSQIFGEVDLMMELDYALIAIHPEANVIFFVWKFSGTGNIEVKTCMTWVRTQAIRSGY